MITSGEQEGPRQEDMELAAKIAIMADEPNVLTVNEADDVQNEAGEDQNERANTSFYDEKLGVANRRQQVKERRQSREELQEVKEDEKDAVDPPSVIAIPEDADETVLSEDDLDTLSQSIPLVFAKLVQDSRGLSAKTLDQRFQQITEMLIGLQQRQIEAYEGQRLGAQPPASSLTSSAMHNLQGKATRAQELE